MAVTVGPRTLLLTVVVTALLSSAYSLDFEYCNKRAHYPVKVKGIEISPLPIKRGVPVSFSISASAGESISKGKLVIDVAYWIIHVHEEIDDLCTKTSCPITTGDFVISHQQTLPSLTPPGSYTLTMKLLGEDGKELLTCISFGFSIGFASEVADS